MRIISNIEISENSIREFLRVLIPKWEKSQIKINYEELEENSKISVEVEVEGLKKKYTYNKYRNIEDQHIIIIKSSLLKLSNSISPWGGLIGVRPTKVLKRLENLGYEINDIKILLDELYLLSKDKTKLLIDIYMKSKKMLNRNATSLYIGIPFCPTKCIYCSFASFEIRSPVGERYYRGFVETLLKEIELVGSIIRKNRLNIESIYIGGGTPSTLDERSLEEILKKIDQYIEKENIKEYTFEAGREDTITYKKLELLKEYGVNRVSLNPQTFNSKTLATINRKFNLENFDKCYNWMKDFNFIINMDLIIGLPGENENDVLETLEKIKKYNIENLTIHNLAIKKSSPLYREINKKTNAMNQEMIENKIKETIDFLQMKPYYIYRQKNSAKWGENLGYSKEGYESIFNMEMIEENQNTIGIGGGAITKKINFSTENRDNVVRVINPKEPATYIDEMEKRHKEKEILFNEN